MHNKKKKVLLFQQSTITLFASENMAWILPQKKNKITTSSHQRHCIFQDIHLTSHSAHELSHIYIVYIYYLSMYINIDKEYKRPLVYGDKVSSACAGSRGRQWEQTTVGRQKYVVKEG